MKKPLILVTNDDGITSHGIRTLIDTVSELGEVVIVAPNSPQSGMGHAITIGNTLRLDENDIYKGIPAYECSGTPADCVKLAKHIVLKDRVPDLVVSGINHGSNSSISVLYSGTMSAAIEAAIEGMPSIGFSHCDHNPNADMNHCKKIVREIVTQVLKTGLPRGVALNVNIPAKTKEKIKGIKICRQANSQWKESFDERKDPYGRRYFWMNGTFSNNDKSQDTDEWALENNYVSVVPCAFDLTAHHAISILNSEWSI
jgi:5'-nucleotidase